MTPRDALTFLPKTSKADALNSSYDPYFIPPGEELLAPLVPDSLPAERQRDLHKILANEHRRRNPKNLRITRIPAGVSGPTPDFFLTRRKHRHPK